MKSKKSDLLQTQVSPWWGEVKVKPWPPAGKNSENVWFSSDGQITWAHSSHDKPWLEALRWACANLRLSILVQQKVGHQSREGKEKQGNGKRPCEREPGLGFLELSPYGLRYWATFQKENLWSVNPMGQASESVKCQSQRPCIKMGDIVTLPVCSP